MATQTEEFTLLDKAEADAIFLTDSQKPDPVWVQRFSTMPVGQAFRIARPNTENVRAFKKRINRAAAVHFKTLEWKSMDTNLPEGVEPSHFTTKVKSLDLKAKAEFEARAANTSQNGMNGTSEPSTPSEPTPSTPESPTTEEAPSGPRRPR